MTDNRIELLRELLARRARLWVSPPLAPRRPDHSVLVLDESGSMEDLDISPTRYLAGVAAAAEYMEERLRGSPADTCSIVLFNGRSRVLFERRPLGDSRQAMVERLRSIEPDDGTDIEKGLLAAQRLLTREDGEYRQRIVLLTDGHGGRPERVAAELKRAGVLIDVIGVGGTPAAVNEVCLRAVASVVDGKSRYRFITNRAELADHFRSIATGLVRV